jgi:hypothetical protein
VAEFWHPTGRGIPLIPLQGYHTAPQGQSSPRPPPVTSRAAPGAPRGRTHARSTGFRERWQTGPDSGRRWQNTRSASIGVCAGPDRFSLVNDGAPGRNRTCDTRFRKSFDGAYYAFYQRLSRARGSRRSRHTTPHDSGSRHKPCHGGAPLHTLTSCRPGCLYSCLTAHASQLWGFKSEGGLDHYAHVLNQRKLLVVG